MILCNLCRNKTSFPTATIKITKWEGHANGHVVHTRHYCSRCSVKVERAIDDREKDPPSYAV